MEDSKGLLEAVEIFKDGIFVLGLVNYVLFIIVSQPMYIIEFCFLMF